MADWLIGDCRCSCVLFDFSGASGVFSPRPRCPDRHGAETRLRGNHPYHLVDFVSIFCITGFSAGCFILWHRLGHKKIKSHKNVHFTYIIS